MYLSEEKHDAQMNSKKLIRKLYDDPKIHNRDALKHPCVEYKDYLTKLVCMKRAKQTLPRSLLYSSEKLPRF